VCILDYSIAGGTIMGEKRTMTLNLSEEEMKSLEELAFRSDMSKTAVIKKAIRIYLVLEKRMQKGEHIYVEDELHQMKAELLLV
jgi:predicted transcriptional regulator